MSKILRTLFAFFMTAMLLIPAALHADEVTINEDATSSTDYIPIYGYYVDSYSHTQTLYTAEELGADLAGSHITGMTFYDNANSTAVSWGAAQFAVTLFETTTNVMSNTFLTPSDETQVYAGSLSVVNGELAITFAEAYEYNGGNLVIDVRVTTTGTYERVYFKSRSTTFSDYRGVYSTSSTATSGTTQSYQPMVTISYEPISSCARPQNLRMVDQSDDTATFAWSAGAEETSWGIVITNGTTELVNTTVSDSTYTLTGLSLSTSYTLQVEVSNVCSAEEIGTRKGKFTFTTPCGPSSLPIEQPFNAAGLPLCWDTLRASGTFPNVLSGNSHTGSYSLAFSKSNIDQTVVMPEMIAGANEVMIRFWAKSQVGAGYSKLIVGAMSDPNDISTFVALDTVPQLNSYVEYKYYLNNAPASCHYLAFRYAGGTSTTGTAYIDDVTISALPTCYPVTEARVKEVNGHAVTFAWNEPIDGGNNFRVELIYQSDTLARAMVNDTVGTLSVPMGAVLTNAELRITNVCGTNDESEAFSTFVNVNTECETISSLPWTESFELIPRGTATSADPHCWLTLNTPHTSSDYPQIYVNNSSTYVHSGSNSLYFTSNKDVPSFAIFPPIADGLLDDAELDFWFKLENVTNSGIPTVGYLTDVTDAESFVEIETIARPQSTAFVKVEVELGTIPAGARLAIRYANAGSSNYYMGIDDIEIRALPQCMHIKDVTLSDITLTSATFSWAEPKHSGTYRIKITAADSTILANTTTSEPTFTLTGLSAATRYANTVVEVTTLCNEDESEVFTKTFTFDTQYEPFAIPFEEMFDGTYVNTPESSRLLPIGWTGYRNGNYTYVMPTSTNHSGSNSLYLYGGTSTTTELVVLPEMQEDANLCMVKLWAYFSSVGSSYPKIVVGAMSDPADSSTFVGIDTIAGSRSWEEYTIYMNAAPANYKYIAIKHCDGTTSGQANIDDITVTYLPTCYPVKDIRLSSTSTTTAEIIWTPRGDETAWNVRYHAHTSSDTLEAHVTGDPKLLLTSLNPATHYRYTFSIQSDCGNGDLSDDVAAGEVLFTTDCGMLTYEDSLVFNFDDMDTSVYLDTVPCWDTLWVSASKPSTSSYGRWQTTSLYTRSGNRSIKVNGTYNSSYRSALVFPVVELHENSELVAFAREGYSHEAADSVVFYVNSKPSLQGALRIGALTDLSNSSYKMLRAPILNMRDSAYIIAVANSYNDIYLDDIVLRPAPNCSPATGLSLDSVGTNAIKLSWNAGGEETRWLVTIDDSDYAGELSEEDIEVEDEPVLILSDIEANFIDTLKVSVRAVCDDDNISVEELTGTFAFHTDCEAIDLTDVRGSQEAFRANFDEWDVADRATLFEEDCWKLNLAATSSSYTLYTLKIDTTSSHTISGKSLYTVGTSGYSSGQCNFALPKMHADGASNFVVSFAAARSPYGSSSNSVGVYINNSPSLTNAISVGNTGNLTSTMTSYTFEIPASVEMEDFYVIISLMLGSSYSTNEIYIDDIVLTRKPDCRIVSDLQATGISTTAGEIRWQPGFEETNWAVKVMTTDSTVVYSGTTDEPRIEISGLAHSTLHTLLVSVAPVCEEEEAPVLSSTVRFSTLCEAITSIPWVEGFEEMEVGSRTSVAPLCWSMVGANNGNYPYIYVDNTSSYVKSGSKSLRFVSSATEYAYLLFPEFEDGLLSNAEVLFDYRSESATMSGIATVGYMTDNTGSSFVALDTLLRETDWNRAEVDLSDIPADARIAIRYGGGPNDNYYFNIDNVTVREIPTCRPTTRASLKEIGQRDITVAWAPVEGVTTHHVVLSDGETVLADTLINDTIAVIGGLEPAHAYTNLRVMIYAQCSGVDSPDAYTLPLSITTACAPISSLPWSEDFENLAIGNNTSAAPICWAMLHANDGSYPYIYVSATNSGYIKTGLRSLFFTSSNTRSGFIILPEMDPTLYATAELSFWYKMESTTMSGVPTIGYMTDISDSATFVAIKVLPRSTTWEQAVTELASVPENGRIAIRYGKQNNNYYMGIDDILIRERPACIGATGLALAENGVGSTEATITWEGIEDAGYKLLLKSGNIEIADSVGTTSYTISGLTPATTYTFACEIVTVCESGVSPDTLKRSVTFTTECAAMPLPYVENFTQSTMPLCWTKATNSTYPSISSYASSYTHTGSYALYFYGGSDANESDIAILPEIDADIQDLRIRLWAYSSEYSSYGFIEVGTMSDIEDPSTFVTIETLPKKASSTQYTIYTNTAPANATHIALRYTGGTSSYGSAYIDDITIDRIPTCWPTNNVEVDSATLHNAYLHWAEPSVEGDYHVVLTNGDKLHVDTIVSDTTLTLTSLPSGTSFANTSISITTLCSATDSSEVYSSTIHFTTLCETIESLPWSEDFEGFSTYTFDDPCWTMTATSGNAYATTSTLGDNTSRKIFIPSSSVDLTFDLPSINIPAADMYEIALDVYRTTTYATYTLEGLNIIAGGEVLAFIPRVATQSSDQIIAETGEGWYRYHIALPVSGEQSIRIEAVRQNGGSIYFDNVSIGLIPTCKPVAQIALVDGSVTSNSATFAWLSSGEDASYHLTLMNGNDQLADTIVSDTTFVLSGLQMATVYNVRATIATSCGEEESETITRSFGFTTECSAITSLPWYEDFSTISTNSMLLCWDNSEGTTSNASYKFVGYSDSDNMCVRFDSYANSKNNTNILKTPEIVLPEDSTLFIFSWKDPTGGDLDVMISADGGATVADTLTTKTNGQSTWKADSISLSAYAGETVVFLFKGTSNYGNGTAYIFLDNIGVIYKEQCDLATDVTLSATGDHSATFAWDGGESSSWEVTAVVNGVTSTQEVSAPNLTLNDLQPYTQYEVTLRITSVCASGIKTLPVVETFRFRTLLPEDYTENISAEATFVADFDSEEERSKWLIEGADQPNHFIFGTAADALCGESEYGLYISNNNADWNYDLNHTSASFVSRLFAIQEDSATIVVRFDWQAYGESGYDFGRAFIAPQDASFSISGSSLQLNGTTIVNSNAETELANVYNIHSNNSVKLNLTSEWVSVEDSVTLNAGTYAIVFTWRNDGSGGSQKPFAVGNISIENRAENHSHGTSVDAIRTDNDHAEKFVRDGQVYIRRNGVVYTILGIKEE